MGRTTISRDLIEMIRLGRAAKEEVLRHLADASSGARQLRHGAPAVTIRFETLRTSSSSSSSTSGHDRPAPPPPLLARGTAYRGTGEPLYDLGMVEHLYDLSDADRVDVIRFGRHPDQDVQLLDRIVSREHGLVIFAEPVPLFCDYGTLIEGKHSGSTNGTYLDGVTRIHDAMFPWLPGQALMLGTEARDVQGTPGFAFRLTYARAPVN